MRKGQRNERTVNKTIVELTDIFTATYKDNQGTEFFCNTISSSEIKKVAAALIERLNNPEIFWEVFAKILGKSSVFKYAKLTEIDAEFFDEDFKDKLFMMYSVLNNKGYGK